ncbi:hypothetical protein AB0G96_11995, partial [Streptomyces mobaraensis]
TAPARPAAANGTGPARRRERHRPGPPPRTAPARPAAANGTGRARRTGADTIAALRRFPL